MKQLIAAVFVLLGLLASDASATREWDLLTSDIERNLESGDHRAAERLASKLGNKLVNGDWEEAKLDRSFALVMAYRAAAALGAGRTTDADFYWASAVALDPSIEMAALPAFDALRKRREPPPASAKGVGKPEPEDPSVVKPRVVVRPQPSYPRNLDWPAQVVVVVYVGLDGRAHSPGFHQSEQAPAAMRYVTLNALSNWRFEPGTCAGAPCKQSFSLTVTFIRRERSKVSSGKRSLELAP